MRSTLGRHPVADMRAITPRSGQNKPMTIRALAQATWVTVCLSAGTAAQALANTVIGG